MSFVSGAIFSFIVLGLIEGIVKPIAANQVRKKTLRYLPELLQYLDHLMPKALADMTEDELRVAMIAKFEKLSGEQINDYQGAVIVSELSEVYSPFKNVEKLNG